MDTTIFCNAIGMTVFELTSKIPEDWHNVYNDNFVFVYRHNTADAFCIFACDNNRIVRTLDIKKKKNGKYESIFIHTGLFENLDSYNAIKNDEDIMERIAKIYGNKFPVCFELERKLALRRFYQKMDGKPVYNSTSLCNNNKQWRTVSDNGNECTTDFIIIPDKWTDLWGTDDEQTIYDDIEDFVYSTVGYDSGYDFPTGREITLRWSFKRLPCGVGIVHDRGIDW